MKNISRLLVLLLLSFTACKKDTATPQPENPEKEILNVAYGNHALQKMDVYFPKGYTTQTPVCFILHGGGFLAGTKEEFTTQSKLMRNQGFVTVNLSYRLVDTTGLLQTPPVHRASDIKVRDIIADVNEAVKKYQNSAAGWGSGTSKMYMAGHSAGAIGALLYTQGEYNVDHHIRACGNWAGVTDMSIPHDSLLDDMDPRYIEALYRLTGHMPSTANNLAYMAISPYWVAYGKAGLATISIFLSENNVFNFPDEVRWSYDQHMAFHNMLRNKNVNERLSVYTGSDHGFGTPAGSWEKLIKETADFFKAN